MHDKEIQLLSEYSNLKVGLDSFGNFVDFTLPSLLSSHGFDVKLFQISPRYRLKDEQSLIKKAFYKNKNYPDDPIQLLTKITDKVGTRIVVKSLREVKDIIKVINKTTGQYWDVFEDRSIDSYYEKPKEFDYHSVHFHLWPNNNTPALSGVNIELRDIFKCELQIRTLLEHAFAEICHDTIYKGEYGKDSKIVRIMSRSMALMEATDHYFEKVIKKMNKEITIEKHFIDQLTRLSRELFGMEAANIDHDLNKEALSVFKIDKTDFQQIEEFFKRDIDGYGIKINTINTYLKNQPILLYFIFLIEYETTRIRDNWILNEDILKDLFFSLGVRY